MANITASMVNELRQMTGAGMMACKKALVATDGDMEAAIDELRKRGESKAAEKADRDTGEGKIFTKKDGNKTAIVKISCETDFVANNENIAEFADSILNEALANGAEAAMNKGEEEVKALVGKIGENIKVEAVELLESEVTGSYVHSNGKIGVIVALSSASEETASEIAMHAAAMNPKYLAPSEVEGSLIEREKAIWAEQLAQEGKPENIMENIMKGKEKKFREENALKTQPFVKDPSMTCETYAKNSGAEITGFVRFSI